MGFADFVNKKPGNRTYNTIVRFAQTIDLMKKTVILVGYWCQHYTFFGGVAEWFKATVLKTVVP